MKIKYTFFLVGIIFFLLSCSKDDAVDLPDCNVVIGKGEVGLSKDAIDIIAPDYINTENSIRLFNKDGDSIVLAYEYISHGYSDYSSERPCDDGVNVYKYDFEHIFISYANDEYNLIIRSFLSLNIDFSSLTDTLIILEPLNYDTCYAERFHVGLTSNFNSKYNSINKLINPSNCDDTGGSFSEIGLENFPAISLNGVIFRDVISNKNLQSEQDFNKMFYNNTEGFLGFEDNDQVLWAIKD